MISRCAGFIRKSILIFCPFLYDYVLALADASIQDNQVDPALFAFWKKTLSLMEEDLIESFDQYFWVEFYRDFRVVLNLCMNVVSVIGLDFLFDYSFR